LEEILGQRVDLVTVESLTHGRKTPRREHIADDIEKTLINVNPTA
jgi:predicted nucleotidyltransferase